MTARTRHPEQDSQTGQAEQADRTGLPLQDFQGGTARTGRSKKDAGKGQLGQNRTVFLPTDSEQ
jgi:hypothetical protein